MPERIIMTAHALEECKKELEYLKTVRAKEIADTIKRTRTFGSLLENSEHEQAVSDQRELWARVAQLESVVASNI